MNWEFEEISYAYLFILLPFLIWRLYYLYQWKQKKINGFADFSLQKRLFNNLNFPKFIRDNILVLIIFILLIFSLMDLKGGQEKKEVRREGIDIVFVIDVSRSMDSEDVAPSRIEKAKKIVSEVIQKLAGDRVGIVVFAERAYSVMPLSNDYNAAELYLSGINTDLILSQGTNVAEAVSEASNMLSRTLNTSKVILLISDGEAHEGNIKEAVKTSKENNITIFSVGIGTPEGAPIPLKNNSGYKRDQEGNIVLTRLRDESLKQVASQTGGIYLNGIYDSNIISDDIFDSLSKIQKTEQSVNYVVDAKHYFQIFLAPALILLIIVSLTNYKRDINV